MSDLLSLVLLPILGVFSLLTELSVFGVSFASLIIAFIITSLLIGYIRG